MVLARATFQVATRAVNLAPGSTRCGAGAFEGERAGAARRRGVAGGQEPDGRGRYGGDHHEGEGQDQSAHGVARGVADGEHSPDVDGVLRGCARVPRQEFQTERSQWAGDVVYGIELVSVYYLICSSPYDLMCRSVSAR